MGCDRQDSYALRAERGHDTMADSLSSLSFESRWGRAVVSDQGDRTDLLIRITASKPGGSQPKRAPVDVAFVLDRSGSMGGEKIQVSKHAVDVALDQLQEQDRATIVAFDDEISLLHQLAPATMLNRIAMRASLYRLDARGSTDLGGGWLTGCQQLAAAESGRGDVRLKRAIVLTDGMANVGITDPGELAHHAGELRSRGIATTTLGIGAGFDEFLLAEMAEAGGGNFEYLASARQLVPFFSRELGELLATVAANLTLTVTLPYGMRGTVLGNVPHTREGKTFTISLGDVTAGETIDLLLHLGTRDGAPGDLLPLAITARWTETERGTHGTWKGDQPPLMRVRADEAAATPIDPMVQERTALHRAADARRQAMLLDRKGDHAGSRHMLRDAQTLLQAAPQTAGILHEMADLSAIADADATQPLSEEQLAMAAAQAAERQFMDFTQETLR